LKKETRSGCYPRRHVDAGFFSSSRRLRLSVGTRFSGSGRRGYYIDLTAKATQAGPWPPPWLRAGHGHVALAQLGLGHFERYAATGADRHLAAARTAGDHLVSTQVREAGVHSGGWLHTFPYVHRAPLRTPWLSAMAQGEAASLLTRLFVETGDERYAESAVLALRPMRVPVESGGVLGEMGGLPFLEEYPTNPQSHVLNGAIFALWGARDVALATSDSDAERLQTDVVATLKATCARWDTGRWSRYDLFPTPPRNVSSSFYHQLHINQLKALHILYGAPEFQGLAARFEAYAANPLLRAAAFVSKVAYRVAIPRHRIHGGDDAERDPATPANGAPRHILLKILHFHPIRRS
jgi:heparosan-N-sulfate-glucuronate 5-epimerase